MGFGNIKFHSLRESGAVHQILSQIAAMFVCLHLKTWQIQHYVNQHLVAAAEAVTTGQPETQFSIPAPYRLMTGLLSLLQVMSDLFFGRK
jgi:hypothetical protein